MTTDLFSVQDKTALFTGSSQGLGLALAQGLGRAGSTIILNGRDADKLARAVESLRSTGIAAYGYAFDVRDETAVTEGIGAIESQVGPIDILFNNAGVMIRNELQSFSLADWQATLDVNLTGAFLVSKCVAQGMIKRRAGKIINICSMQSEMSRPTIAPYAASKGGLKMLTRGMATDWGKYNIQTNGLGPGYFKTELTRPLYEDPEFDAWLCRRTPAQRWGELDELIGAALFLSSKASDYVNGQILYVDGGLLACL